jgi:outer membrane immunogenic protein
MKRVCLGLVLASSAALSAGSALADGMNRGSIKDAPGYCAVDRFRGGYIGINGGVVNWTANRTDQDEVLVDSATYVQRDWSGVIGGQIGYNWGSGCSTLWGVEIDGDWSNARASTQIIPNAPLFDIDIKSRFEGLVTARTRVGIVHDNVLLYLTGGVATGHFNTTYTNRFLGIAGVIPGVTNQASVDEWRWGMVAGAGAEWAWTDRVTIRSEVLYVDFADSEKRFLFAPPATFANFTQSDSMWISRLGVNFKF